MTDLRAMYDQNAFFRRHAFGAFGDLVRGVARDPAMLVWVGAEANRKAVPNQKSAQRGYQVGRLRQMEERKRRPLRRRRLLETG